MATRKLSDQIVEDLLSDIGSSVLAEGSPLPSEMSLCASYKVNRGVVREALSSLNAKGFIKTAQGLKTTVAHSYEWNVLDGVWLKVNSGVRYYDSLQETRELLEPELAYIAAKNATEEDIAELQRLLTLQQNCSGDAQAHAKLDIEWHLALARATHNPVLNQLHNSIANLGMKTRTAASSSPSAIESAIEWHSQIAQAVSAKNPELAKAAMQMHLSQVRVAVAKGIKHTQNVQSV